MTTDRSTAACAILLADAQGAVLLQERDEHAPTGPGRWATVGGGLEPGESPSAGAERELAEETGLSGQQLVEWFRGDFPSATGHGLTAWHVYVGRTQASDADIVLGEGRAIRFVSPGEFRGLDVMEPARAIVELFLLSDTYRALAGEEPAAAAVEPRAKIRPATLADAGEILTLQRAAWVPEAQRHGWLFIPPITQTLNELRADIDTQTVLVAVAGHRIVGTVRGVRDGDDWYIGRLGVAPDLQGNGLGARLLAAVESLAPGGITRFRLTTGPKSTENIAFYERRGYRRVPSTDELVHLVKETAEPNT